MANVTIEDIAAKAGVGRGTVDRVLHNRGRVSEETRARVLQCIKDLGYEPNKAARMLAKTREYRIAVTFHDTEKYFWKFVEEGIDRAEKQYRAMGVVVDRYILPEISISEQVKVINHVIAEKYDGLAITPYNSEEVVNAINRAVAGETKVVTFNNDEICNRSCYVGQDMYKSGQTAGKLFGLMAPQNAKYATFKAAPTLMSELDLRYQGFSEETKMLRSDLQLVNEFTAEVGENESEKTYKDAVDLLKSNNVDAIYATNGIVASVAEAIEAVKPENKPLLIGHDLNDPVIEYLDKGLIDVAIGQAPEEQGYGAIDALCRNLLAGEDISKDIFTKIEVITKENLMFRSR